MRQYLIESALVLFASLVAFSAGYNAASGKAKKCPDVHKFNFTVVDSIGRRYLPVPCPCESQHHEGCGYLEEYEEGMKQQEEELFVTIIHASGKRTKEIFVIEDYNNDPDCEGYRPNFRLERIEHSHFNY